MIINHEDSIDELIDDTMYDLIDSGLSRKEAAAIMTEESIEIGDAPLIRVKALQASKEGEGNDDRTETRIGCLEGDASVVLYEDC